MIHVFVDRNLKIARALRKKGQFSMYIFLCTLKNQQDKSAFITEKEFDFIKDYSYQTKQKYIKRLIKMGWASKGKSCYYLKSIVKIGHQNNINLKYAKTISGETKKELDARMAHRYIERNCSAQVSKKYPTLKKIKIKQIIQSSHNGEFGISVRYISKLLGFASSTSGTTVFREMVRLKLIKRRSRSQYVCGISSLSDYVMKQFDGRLYLDDFKVMARLSSIIIFM